MRIYLASSWRNARYPQVLAALRAAAHQVFDFRQPHGHANGFSWDVVDPAWRDWTLQDYRTALLTNPLAAQRFSEDARALAWCDGCVLVHPSGRDSHLELGWAAGAGKRAIILLADGDRQVGEPDLMTLLATDIVTTIDELLAALR
jgi:hypothetical protein